MPMVPRMVGVWFLHLPWRCPSPGMAQSLGASWLLLPWHLVNDTRENFARLKVSCGFSGANPAQSSRAFWTRALGPCPPISPSFQKGPERFQELSWLPSVWSVLLLVPGLTGLSCTHIPGCSPLSSHPFKSPACQSLPVWGAIVPFSCKAVWPHGRARVLEK